MTARAAPSEPSFAERVRTLVHLGRLGTLSTHSRRVAGFPFGSVAPYGVDAGGCPTFLFSSMAMHAQNLAVDARASLLVTQSAPASNPLALARATLLGPVARVGDGEVDTVKEDYLRRHADARQWVGFGDFAFYRLQVEELYYVAGFGAMGWVGAAEYGHAAPDPLADAAADILQHMNADHAEALVLYCRAFGGLDGVEQATMIGIDRLGFHLHARSTQDEQTVRIAFANEVRTTEAARSALVDLVRQARARLAAAPA